MKILMNQKNAVKLCFLVTLLGLALSTFFAFQVSAKSYVYVDKDASGKMDGSSKNPFKKIQDGIDYAKDHKRDVLIKKGEYKENIDIWEGVKVEGVDKKNVVIKSAGKDDEVVKMHDHTLLGKVTVKDGEVGVKVDTGAEAHIYDCIIEDNDKDGIQAKEGETAEKDKLYVQDTLIRRNGWSGIYSKKREIWLGNNDIIDNKKDGVDLEAGIKGSAKDNLIKDNNGVGLKLRVDGSDLWLEDNTIRDNGKEGIEVKNYGGNGLIQVREGKFWKNDRWGIARISVGSISNGVWDSRFKILSENEFLDNKFGAISHIIRVR